MHAPGRFVGTSVVTRHNDSYYYRNSGSTTKLWLLDDGNYDKFLV